MINRAIRPYYPGSIFKVVIAAAALSTGAKSPDSVYTDTGSIEAGGHVFRCHAQERGGHGDITFQDALIHSCNTSFIDAAMQLGAQPILDFGRALGIGDPDVASAVRLPGSLTGVLPYSRTRLGPADLANLALGQSLVQITPLEAAVMMCVVANGGMACRPELVLEACGPDGRRVIRVPSQALGDRVLRADVAAALREMLAGVASRGTASAVLGGMDVAGKTGTAQTGRVDGSGAPIFNAWFVGFAPVESPRLVVAVLVEGTESGASAAAPVFGDICEYAIGGARGRAR
jgi:cell division protein FtsI/penicillin-binding protein 2